MSSSPLPSPPFPSPPQIDHTLSLTLPSHHPTLSYPILFYPSATLHHPCIPPLPCKLPSLPISLSSPTTLPYSTLHSHSLLYPLISCPLPSSYPIPLFSSLSTVTYAPISSHQPVPYHSPSSPLLPSPATSLLPSLNTRGTTFQIRTKGQGKSKAETSWYQNL